MSDEERRTVMITAGVLLLASLVRFGWEARPLPPILPLEPPPAALLEETRLAVEREERMRTPLGPGERLDPNRVPDVELARLPGIGPALAARIVESRETAGPFVAPTDLLRVSGVGPATLARIEDLLDLSEPPPARPAQVAGPTLGSSQQRGGGPAAAGELLDLNRAGPGELETLPGIGPALAQRIVEHRERAGRFSNVDALLAVPGIGPATLERLRPHVRVGG